MSESLVAAIRLTNSVLNGVVRNATVSASGRSRLAKLTFFIPATAIGSSFIGIPLTPIGTSFVSVPFTAIPPPFIILAIITRLDMRAITRT